MPAIYKITNTKTGETYVGGATDYVERKSGHKHHLRCGTHHSSLLQKNWNKYGERAFVFEVIETVDDRAQLRIREQYWIDQLRPMLNRCKCATSPKGLKHTKEARKRMSDAHRGKKLTPEALAKRSVKQSGKNHWTYGKPRDEKTRKKISKKIKEWFKTHPHPLKGLPVSRETKEKVRKALAHPVAQYTKEGTLLKIWRDAREAEESIGVWRTHINACVNGKQKTAGGFVWKRAKEE